MTAWTRGWITLPERDPQAGPRLHRPWPQQPGYTLCGRLVPEPWRRAARKPAGVLECLLCLQLHQPAGVKSRDVAPKEKQPRPVVVQVVSGGLPGLGRRS